MTNSLHGEDGVFSRLTEETSFYIIRHGESEGNSRRIIQGHKDFPLNDAGRSQAESLGRWLAPKRPSTILCSPLVRARETAEIVARACRLASPVPDPLFREIDTGDFSGLSLEDAAEKFPEDYERFRYLSWDGVLSAETSSSLSKRSQEAWARLCELAEKGDRNIAVVSHGGFIQWLFRITFGYESWMPLMMTGNCGVFLLHALPVEPGKPCVLQWRLVNHRVEGSHRGHAPVF